MRSDKGYMSDEFKKENTPTFEGEMKKYHDVEAWLIGMRKFFSLDDYLENMKAIIATFGLVEGPEIGSTTRGIPTRSGTWLAAPCPFGVAGPTGDDGTNFLF